MRWTCQEQLFPLFTCSWSVEWQGSKRQAPLGHHSLELPTAHRSHRVFFSYWRLSEPLKSSEKWLISVLRFLLSPHKWGFSSSFLYTTYLCIRRGTSITGVRLFRAKVMHGSFYTLVFNTVSGSPHLRQFKACITDFKNAFLFWYFINF